MTSLSLSPEELKILDSIRSRLSQLSHSISSLQADLYRNTPLPNPASIEVSARIIKDNLAVVQRYLSDHAHLLSRVAVHPSTNYPGRTQQDLLALLLRKRLEPGIEAWADDSRAATEAAGVDVTKITAQPARPPKRQRRMVEEEDDDDNDNDYNDDENDVDDDYGYKGYDSDEDEGEDDAPDDGAVQETGDPLLDKWAAIRYICLDRMGAFIKKENKDPYTAEERAMGIENVRTGLRRNLVEESDDDEDDEDDEDDGEDGNDDAGAEATAGAGQEGGVTTTPSRGLKPEHVLWLMARGDLDLPPNIEFDNPRGVGPAATAPSGAARAPGIGAMGPMGMAPAGMGP